MYILKLYVYAVKVAHVIKGNWYKLVLLHLLNCETFHYFPSKIAIQTLGDGQYVIFIPPSVSKGMNVTLIYNS